MPTIRALSVPLPSLRTSAVCARAAGWALGALLTVSACTPSPPGDQPRAEQAQGSQTPGDQWVRAALQVHKFGFLPYSGPKIELVREPVAVTVKDGDLCFALTPEQPQRYRTVNGMLLSSPTGNVTRSSEAVRNLYSVPSLCLTYADMFGARASDDLGDGRYSLLVLGSFSEPSPDPSISRSVSLEASFKLSRDAGGHLVLTPLPLNPPRPTAAQAPVRRSGPMRRPRQLP